MKDRKEAFPIQFLANKSDKEKHSVTQQLQHIPENEHITKYK